MKNIIKLIFLDSELTGCNKIIKKYKTIYEKNIKNVHSYVEKRQLVMNIISNIIKEYSYFNNNALIFFTGSYARGIIKESSDFDLNVVYLKGSGKKYKKYEELFFYIICSVFNKARKYVHPVLVTFNDKNNTNYIQSKMNGKDVYINLVSDNYFIHYMIPKGSKKRIYLQYLNNKNYKTIFNNLFKDPISEWQFTIKFLNKNEKIINYYKELTKKQLSNDLLKNRLEDFKSSIIDSLDKDTFNLKKIVLIKDIKLYYQHNVLKFIYDFILYNKIKSNSNEVNMSDLYSQNIPEIKFLVCYIKSLQKLNNLFLDNQIDYSIHNFEKIDLHKHIDIRNFIILLEKKSKRIKKYIKHQLFKYN